MGKRVASGRPGARRAERNGLLGGRRVGLIGMTVLVASLATAGVVSATDLGTTDDTGSASDTTPPTADSFRYVALGDSYTSAPGIAGLDTSQGCLRSANNYPALVAREMDADELVDVSCSGAQTIQMTREHVIGEDVQPPQFDALTADTDLVTISIGANDHGLFSRMVRRCADLAPRQPDGAPCEADQNAPGWDTAAGHVNSIRMRVVGVVEGVRERAPEATVILVGYPQLVPEEGRCPNRLPLALGDYAFVKQTIDALSGAIEDAAEATGAGYVDLLTASEGFDVCARSPWINGAVEKPDRALPFHPYPAEQRAVADLVLEQLGT